LPYIMPDKSPDISGRIAQGKTGEKQAAEALEAAGMKIIAKNFRSKFGEIDIIAVDESAGNPASDILVFAEVKAWSAFGIENLQYSIDIKKQNKIIKTAKYFLSENRKYSNMSVRFDVVFVKSAKPPERCQITHLASAFMERV